MRGVGEIRVIFLNLKVKDPFGRFGVDTTSI
jgi:hypothetical protein